MIHFFSVYHFSLDSEIIKPIADSTVRMLKTYETRIFSIELDRLLEKVNKFR